MGELEISMILSDYDINLEFLHSELKKSAIDEMPG